MSAIDVGAGDSARAKSERDKTLSDLVAVTVVVLSVFMAISKTKDDNINQAMQKAKADSVDAWAEYQFARVKLHVDENGLNQLRLLEIGGQIDKALAAKQAAEYEADIKKYEGRSRKRAPRPSGSRPNTTGSISATTSSTCRTCSCRSRSRSPRSRRWSICSAALCRLGQRRAGLGFGIAGFAGWNFRPEWLA